MSKITVADVKAIVLPHQMAGHVVADVWGDQVTDILTNRLQAVMQEYREGELEVTFPHLNGGCNTAYLTADGTLTYDHESAYPRRVVSLEELESELAKWVKHRVGNLPHLT